MEDNTMAIIQIARSQSFMLGRGGGNDPSMFELDLRAADRLGTTEAFERAFENALRLEAPADVVIDSQTPVPTNQAPMNCTGPAGSSLSEPDVQITHVTTRIRHSSRADDDVDVLITGQTFKTRPLTRGTPTPIRTNDIDPPIVAQHGQLVIERDCDKRFWHLSRITISGNPVCNATLSGPNASRDLCKTKIKSSGVKMRGVCYCCSIVLRIPSLSGRGETSPILVLSKHAMCPFERFACLQIPDATSNRDHSSRYWDKSHAG
ncbi:hypothetical protein R1sor_007636 [Riccia sorocarpa]|uniref:Uncharacterized protein n=1 Tax=Riccia sorocarpa TaxID=122646 RepID=A0ABD3HUN5_9MARC